MLDVDDLPVGAHRAVREIPKIVRAACRARGRADEADDLAQEVMVEWLEARERGSAVRHLGAWVRRVLMSLSAGPARNRSDGPGPPAALKPAGGPELDRMYAGRERAPDVEAAIREIAECYPELLARLPQPCRRIAFLECWLDWTSPQIAVWLGLAGGVTVQTGRKWIRVTREMLPALGEGVDLRGQWPERYDPKKNGWQCLHPFPWPLSTDMKPGVRSAIMVILSPSMSAGRTMLEGTDGAGVTRADLAALKNAINQSIRSHGGRDCERYEDRFGCDLVGEDGLTTHYGVRFSRAGQGAPVDRRAPPASGDDITIRVDDEAWPASALVAGTGHGDAASESADGAVAG